MTLTAGLRAPTAEALEDIRDPGAFVVRAVERTFGTNGRMTPDEKEEAIGEGLVLLYELHLEWDPARCERFSAFCLTYLPRKLISWWRRDLRQSGRGRWSGSTGEYRYNGMVSLDVTTDAGCAPGESSDSSLTVWDREPS